MALSALGLLGLPRASATDVKGSVRSSGTPKHKTIEAARMPYWQEWNGFIEPKKPSVDYAREVTVVLIGAESTRDSTTVLIQNGALLPSTIVVQQGVPLRIRNTDDFAHKLSAEKLKGFDAIETSSGQSREIQMLQTGDFVITDKLAPYLKGYLHVLPKVTAIANPESDGSYKFEDVRPGNYTIKVYRGPYEMGSSTLEVKEKGDVSVPAITVDAKAAK